MKVVITYKVKDQVKQKAFVRESVAEAMRFFTWRYSHEVISAIVE